VALHTASHLLLQAPAVGRPGVAQVGNKVRLGQGYVVLEVLLLLVVAVVVLLVS
jgi:hypothetical protein